MVYRHFHANLRVWMTHACVYVYVYVTYVFVYMYIGVSAEPVVTSLETLRACSEFLWSSAGEMTS